MMRNALLGERCERTYSLNLYGANQAGYLIFGNEKEKNCSSEYFLKLTINDIQNVLMKAKYDDGNEIIFLTVPWNFKYDTGQRKIVFIG